MNNNDDMKRMRSQRRVLGTYVDLVVSEALLHLVEKAAVGQLAEGGQVIAGGRGHEPDLWDTETGVTNPPAPGNHGSSEGRCNKAGLAWHKEIFFCVKFFFKNLRSAVFSQG